MADCIWVPQITTTSPRVLDCTMCHTQITLNSLSNWGGHVHELIAFIQRKNILLRSIRRRVVLLLGTRYLSTLLPSMGTMSPEDDVSKRWPLGPRKQYSWVVKPARNSFKDLHLKGAEKEFTVSSFLK